MKGSARLGGILLSIWLIATGVLPLLNISFPAAGTVLALLAIAAGVLLLLQGGRIRLTNNLGTLLLSIWLIASGLLSLLDVSFPGQAIVLAVLAIATGVLLLLRR
jgi:hypothetical protein